MGYYLKSTGSRLMGLHGKAEDLIKDCGAVRIPRPDSFDKVNLGAALICVVNNGPFEAAALVYSEEEFGSFTLPDDHRPKVWLKMDKKTAHELAKYKAKN